jgi:POT family proton-dependent oligopeptide transporter
VLTVLFILLAVMLLIEGIRGGKVVRDKTIAMLVIFGFNIMFWMFFEQAGSSFTFLAENIVNRDFGGWIFPTAWFQTVNSIAIITCAPIVAATWVWLAPQRQSIDPAQVRPGPDLQRRGLPAADVRAVLAGRMPTTRSRSGPCSWST